MIVGFIPIVGQLADIRDLTFQLYEVTQGRGNAAATGNAIEGSYDLGHTFGHEFRTEKAKAEAQGLTQKEFNERMNNPDLYQIEDPSSNRGHLYEQK